MIETNRITHVRREVLHMKNMRVQNERKHAALYGKEVARLILVELESSQFITSTAVSRGRNHVIPGT